MLRFRLACLALATGFVFTLSGCCSTCDDGRLFPRLFQRSARPSMHDECECRNAPNGHNMMPGPMMDPAVQGPILMPGTTGSTVPIIRNTPPMQPPQVFKVPTAPTTPYVPAN